MSSLEHIRNPLYFIFLLILGLYLAISGAVLKRSPIENVQSVSHINEQPQFVAVSNICVPCAHVNRLEWMNG